MTQHDHLFYAEKLNRDFCAYLISRGLNANVDKNDLLIDGYKVASGCENRQFPDLDWNYSAFQFNVNCDLDIIRKYCGKAMKKIPKGLSEYGITIDDVCKWLKNWMAENHLI